VQAENQSIEDLRAWVTFQAETLDREGKLMIEPRSWATSGSDKEKKAIKYLGFLFLAYRVDNWWFEFVTMVYKLFMTSALAFIFR
jgi:hypothetical protein